MDLEQPVAQIVGQRFGGIDLGKLHQVAAHDGGQDRRGMGASPNSAAIAVNEVDGPPVLGRGEPDFDFGWWLEFVANDGADLLVFPGPLKVLHAGRDGQYFALA